MSTACILCDGLGKITVESYLQFTRVETCPACDGSGKLAKLEDSALDFSDELD